jgi:hypothetical protein
VLSGGPQDDPATREHPLSPPYLAWAPLPYDVPGDGIAYACAGTGDQGCLFLDLGRAPGAISIGGERAAAVRLAESIAHQLCSATPPRRCEVVIVGDALPRPHPPGATWLATLDRLTAAVSPPSGAVAIVFCELGSESDALALSRSTAAARCRIVPVVLGGPLAAPWSLTAQPAAGAGRL